MIKPVDQPVVMGVMVAVVRRFLIAVAVLQDNILQDKTFDQTFEIGYVSE